MKFSFLIIAFWTTAIAFGQNFSLETELNSSVNETSGLLFLDNRIITHNDSGGDNALYEIDVTSGNILRTVTISNASNTDWEDLSADDTYIYVADFGNNSGNRTDLKVYRILQSDYLNSESVTAEVINFSYSDQTDFTPNPGPFFSTNFDAEALIHFNNQLYIFTKQWSNENSSVYLLPKTPGTYSLDPLDSIKAEGLITGGTANSSDNKILLTAYTNTLEPYVLELEGFSGGLFSNGVINQYPLSMPNGFSPQIEAITAVDENAFYLTTESLLSLKSGLFSLEFNSLSLSENTLTELNFYPNPSSGIITLTEGTDQIDVYTMSGQLLVSETHRKTLDVSFLSKGIYVVILHNDQNINQAIQKLIIH